VRSHPKITIAITCFNAEDTISDAIASAQAQDWPNLEIVVADDASTDGSWAVLCALAERDERILLIRHDRNRGYAGALNSIVAAARGEFVAVFDDDDVSVAHRVTRQWHRLCEYETAAGTRLALCYSNRKVATPDGVIHPDTVEAVGRRPVEPWGLSVVDYLLYHRENPGFVWGQFGSGTMLARRQTLLEVGGFDESFRRGAEWDFVLRLALKGGHFIAVDEALMTQRKTPTADKSGKTALAYTLQLRNKYRGYLESKGVYRASIAIAHSRFHYTRGEPLRSYFYLALACVCSPSVVLPSEVQKWKTRNSRRVGSLAKNAAFLLTLRVLQQLLRLAMIYFVVRALDNTQFGQYQFILSCAALITMFALPGLNNSLMQSVARGFRGSYRAVVRRAFASSLLGSLVLAGLAVYYAVDGTPALSSGFLLVAVLFPFAGGLEQWRSLKTGAEDFAGMFKTDGIAAVVLAVCMIAAVTARPGTVLVPLGVLYGVQAGLNLLLTRVALRSIPADAPAEAGTLSHGTKTTFYSGFSIVAKQLDKILIFLFLSPAALALFVAAERIPELLKGQVQDLAGVLAPRFAKRARYTNSLDRTLRTMGLIASALAVLVAFTVLPAAIRLLFGEAYVEAIPYSQALMCSTAIGNASILRHRYVTSQLDVESPRVVELATSATRIVSSLVLVPWLGLLGAVISAFIYRVAMTVVVHLVIKKNYLASEAGAR
jgi:O-antigen/teichoic acid export membrane protein/glycosyltransferase involved in cell wall biosynthesis